MRQAEVSSHACERVALEVRTGVTFRDRSTQRRQLLVMAFLAALESCDSGAYDVLYAFSFARRDLCLRKSDELIRQVDVLHDDAELCQDSAAGQSGPHGPSGIGTLAIEGRAMCSPRGSLDSNAVAPAARFAAADGSGFNWRSLDVV